ncbi:MAG: aldehyde dehydrogenase family protein [Actinomycetota bacterium]|nr:aldehyde dehydrogenase family protein [Actinomycetota bacterium]
MSMQQKLGTSWNEIFGRAREAAPEAFGSDRLANHMGGEWKFVGETKPHAVSIDGSLIPGPPRVDHDTAVLAVDQAKLQHVAWSQVPLDERQRRVFHAVTLLREHRDTIALLLMWEIGKPWRIACADVDRCVDGVDWYLGEIERQMQGRTPLQGPISNIASWNYPLSVLVHAELVQLLAGNAVIAKTPSQGGFHALTLSHALMARAGLPVTLLSGVGGELSDALISSTQLGALAFVGGRSNGRKAASMLADLRRRHILEQEGLNAWGIWNFSQWSLLAGHVKKGFEYAKQRCTAYPRYVIQRQLLPDFLAMYTEVVASLNFGNPFAVESADDPFQDFDFGPVISQNKATDLQARYDEAIRIGGIPLICGDLRAGKFIDGQDTSAYVAPACVLNPPSNWSLHHSEPFGPLDSIVLVDTESELLAAMNVSNGALVASIATDDPSLAQRLRPDVQSFKFGVNAPRSRGDRAEVFGGRGASWRGAFVGGDLLIDSVTDGDRPLFGNFPNGSQYPPDI